MYPYPLQILGDLGVVCTCTGGEALLFHFAALRRTEQPQRFGSTPDSPPQDPGITMAPKKTTAAEPMTADGDSAGTQNNHASHETFANAFLASMAQTNPAQQAAWGLDIMKVPEAECCTCDFFGYLSTFSVDTYIIPAGIRHGGNHLEWGTAEGYWNGVMQLLRKRFLNSDRPETIVRAHAHCLRIRAHTDASPAACRTSHVACCPSPSPIGPIGPIGPIAHRPSPIAHRPCMP